MESKQEAVKRLLALTNCGGDAQLTLTQALARAYDAGHGAQNLNAQLVEESESWFRSVMAEEMGVDAPGGEGVNPLRDMLRELKSFKEGGQAADTPEGLLTALQRHGGNLAPLAEAGLVAVRKGKDYNTGVSRDDYFPLGLASYAQMIWVKCLRLVSFAKMPRSEENEGVRDTLLDLINYAAFAADWLHRQSLRLKKESVAGRSA